VDDDTLLQEIPYYVDVDVPYSANILFLDKVKAKEYKYPYQVYKVPVQSCFFHHQVMAFTVERAIQSH
jgi:hypothetical protein